MGPLYGPLGIQYERLFMGTVGAKILTIVHTLAIGAVQQSSVTPPSHLWRWPTSGKNRTTIYALAGAADPDTASFEACKFQIPLR